MELSGEEEPFDVPDFFRHAAVWLVVSSGSSLLLGMAFLFIFKHVPHAMVSQAACLSRDIFPLSS